MIQLLATIICLTALSLVGAVLLKLCVRWIAKEDAPYKSILVGFLFTSCLLILFATLINFGMQGVNRLLRSPDLYEVVEMTKHVLKPIIVLAGLAFFTSDKAHIPMGKSFLSVLLFLPLFIPSFVCIVGLTSSVFSLHPIQLMPQFMY